jgi:polysaccharide biosynthesis/export protein
MRGIPLYLFFIVLTGAFGSCSMQNLMSKSDQAMRNDSLFYQKKNFEYVIKKDDKLSISVWDHEDLSVGSIYGIYNSNEVYGKWLMVDAFGNVAIPKIGEVQVAGKTAIEVEEMLKGIFSKSVLNPIVEVKVLNKEVTVMGEVRTPSKLLLDKEENSILEIISRAGDFDYYANKTKVTVVREIGNVPYKIELDLTGMDIQHSQNILVQPGDIVYVPTRRGKNWDKKASTAIPVTSVITSIIVILTVFK